MHTAVKVIGIVAIGGIAAYLLIGNKDNTAQGPIKPTFRQAHTQGFRAQVAAAIGTSNIGRGGRRTVNGRSLRNWRSGDPVYGGADPFAGVESYGTSWGEVPSPTVDPANPTSTGPGRTPTRTGAGSRHTRS